MDRGFGVQTPEDPLWAWRPFESLRDTFDRCVDWSHSVLEEFTRPGEVVGEDFIDWYDVKTILSYSTPTIELFPDMLVSFGSPSGSPSLVLPCQATSDGGGCFCLVSMSRSIFDTRQHMK